jgi:TatD DNase family protein
MNGLVDIGVNLGHDRFDADRETVMQRAREAGVTRFIVTGTSVTASVRALDLAQARPSEIFATAGIHPHHAAEFDAHTRDALRALLAHESVVAVGECGLDYYRDFSPRDKQRDAFVAQLELAAELDRPVFLHQRDAHEDFLQLLAPLIARVPGGVAHCFTGGPRELAAYLELGLHIGITGWICDERRGAALRGAVPEIPLERLLIETDAPYLLPRDITPKPKSHRNEPAYLPHILERVAALRSEPVELLAAATRQNSERLFRLIPLT